ncbi:hypothetical protein [Paraburkholderia domus]|uniref:hypothetical protein n=1 Tax=Paraburkholderia domus TaxID=2793075 RepID=UPI001911B19D|nr:hypothetical protein [Paraburkholderia domus]MBK5049386.1 hypothetical protein [Burkholderia sp. R-70006]MBK5087305.1 hypothetical protein [Burkholderia sp. R-69927]MBK5166892.1 hypothetical protein [Burkholderia sp. R-70211]MBK5180761.1 hypothetical protein [Burkholderia sp. R-69749]MCI0152257.1 hypothetical protein [Paraburkholderia sediminicola]
MKHASLATHPPAKGQYLLVYKIRPTVADAAQRPFGLQGSSAGTRRAGTGEIR